jgi:hypothetical protein
MEPIPPEALLEPYPPAHREIAARLRAAIRRVVPDVIERVRPGWGLIGYDVPIGPRRTRYFAFLWPEPEHVHLGFEYGTLMDDPERVLQGAGITKKVRWLTFARPADVDVASVERLVAEALRVATLSRGERVALAMEREERRLG